MKIEENRSLEQLEGKPYYRPDTDMESGTVSRWHNLYPMPLSAYEPGDIRFMIGQQTGCLHLVPLALRILSQNMLLETDYYPGDLLKAVLTIPPAFWAAHPLLLADARRVLARERPQMEAPGEYSPTGKNVNKLYEAFFIGDLPPAYDPGSDLQ